MSSEQNLKNGEGVRAEGAGAAIDRLTRELASVREELKLKSEALAQSEQALQTIVEAIPQMVWRCTPDGAADFASQRFCKFVNRSAEEVLGWGWLTLVHPDDRARLEFEWARAREAAQPISVDFRMFVGETEGYRWMRSQGNPSINADGLLERYYGTWTDIHDQVLAEFARRESEERFEVLANSAPVLIWMSKTDKLCHWFNKTWLDWTGRTLAQETGQGWLEGVHPEDRARVSETCARHFERRDAFYMEYRMRHHSGTYRWISDRGVPRFNPAGDFEGFIGGCMDIHDQKQTADATKSSEERFRSLVDHSPAIMWITDHAGSATYLSKQWYEFTGRTPAQDHGFGWLENVHEDDREAAKVSFIEASSARRRVGLRYRLRKHDGTYRWVVDSGLPLISDDGAYMGYIGTVVDIHDQIATEQELLALSERFKRSAAATDLGVWYCDLPFDTLIWNKEVKRHFFVAPDAEVKIDDFYAHIHPEDREKVRAAIQYSIDNRAPYDVQMRTWDKFDLRRVNRIRAIGWTDYDGAGQPVRFDGITLDVTPDFLHRQELEKARDEADRARVTAEIASESKSRFLANMSHEIRTPLSAIMGYSELVGSRIRENGELKTFVERIHKNSTQLGRLIDELLDLSKIEAEKFDLDPKVVNIDQLLDDVFSAMILQAETKGLKLDMRWTSPKPTRVVTDPVRLAQILTNIIGNAVKFTEAGAVHVEVEAKNRLLHFKVTDSGIGLLPDQQQRIFEPFSQADSSVNRRYGGTGLGLSLSKKLAVLLGGDLYLERSQPGEGSVFHIQVALTLGNSGESSDTPALVIEPGAAPLSNKRILIVDDSPDNRTIVGIYLESAGATVLEAVDGDEGVRTALSEALDVVLMDIQMPGADGYEALKRLQQVEYRVPVIALTAHAFKEEKDRCRRAGFIDYITKPVKRSALIENILGVLNKYQANRKSQ